MKNFIVGLVALLLPALAFANDDGAAIAAKANELLGVLGPRLETEIAKLQATERRVEHRSLFQETDMDEQLQRMENEAWRKDDPEARRERSHYAVKSQLPETRDPVVNLAREVRSALTELPLISGRLRAYVSMQQSLAKQGRVDEAKKLRVRTDVEVKKMQSWAKLLAKHAGEYVPRPERPTVRKLAHELMDAVTVFTAEFQKARSASDGRKEAQSSSPTSTERAARPSAR